MGSWCMEGQCRCWYWERRCCQHSDSGRLQVKDVRGSRLSNTLGQVTRDKRRIRALLSQNAKDIKFDENLTTNTLGFEFVYPRRGSERAIVVRMVVPICGFR
jgi:hypothetical protein